MSRVGLIAKKLGMSSMFLGSGKRVTLTLLKVDDCQVVASKTLEKDGYEAVVVGATKCKSSRVSKSLRGIFAQAKMEPRATIKEFRVSRGNLLDIGVELKPSHFKENQYIDVIGTSIGKGFAGVIKRHNFQMQDATHGNSLSHRAPGSIGQCQTPGRVLKGKKMAGHMGNERVTTQNLEIVKIDAEKSVLLIKGAIPGSKNGDVIITPAIKVKK